MYKLFAIKVIVNQREGIVVHLGLVHKVIHKREHHLDLSLQSLALLLDPNPFFHVALDEWDHEPALVKKFLN